ncbi:TonB-dependent receptor, partial [Paludibacteraceae bacterium OttesenSCG-928-F17]|nr:TonB-dependent receptor [Paludibacteraceae bacterium OttesenSCG-928-F17]
STIYVRGLGSRMEHPAMGMNIDNVPVMNKNSYDTDFFDIQRIDILRGPQGTLYGRNSIGGVIDIHTLSPFDYEGTRVELGYGNANTINAKLSTYQKAGDKFGYSISMNHQQSDGFYTNEFDGEKCDNIFSDGLRARLIWKFAERWSLDNTFSLNVVRQDGFAYSLYDEATQETYAVNHNDPCKYERLGLINGTTFRYVGEKVRFSSTTSYQYMDDEMLLDQDFQPQSMFTIQQEQEENAATQEFVLRRADTRAKWQWLFGAFGFYKHNKMNAPVMFKQDGIDRLILANANEGIHSVFPDADLLIEESEFPIHSKFKLSASGVSLYHQSVFNIGSWSFTGGIRFDYEYASIDYHNYSDLHYRFTFTMPQYKLLSISMKDNNHKSFLDFMPKLSALYNLSIGNIYATVARGYKAGGFNTQIFSDILQNKMMNDMMSDLGMYPDDNGTGGYDVEKAISYEPEYSWNYELGSHLKLFKKRLHLDMAFFFIDCRNQQLTVFPPGNGTGRLMSNAGQTGIYGAELSARYIYKGLSLNAGYGYTNSRFVAYDDGKADYSGNYVPYVPQNTVLVGAEYTFNFNKKWIDRLVMQADWRGAGKIYWNESNTLSQPFYGQLGASVAAKKGRFSCGIWGKNLTNTEFNTFYFKSVGNSFVQRGKPIQFGISINVYI